MDPKDFIKGLITKTKSGEIKWDPHYYMCANGKPPYFLYSYDNEDICGFQEYIKATEYPTFRVVIIPPAGAEIDIATDTQEAKQLYQTIFDIDEKELQKQREQSIKEDNCIAAKKCSSIWNLISKGDKNG